MGDHIAGTLTFLFTDIEGSTRRWQHDSRRCRWRLPSTTRPFASPSRRTAARCSSTPAMACARCSRPRRRRWRPRSTRKPALSLPVRMGLHTGEAELRDDDYFGPTHQPRGTGHGRRAWRPGSGVVNDGRLRPRSRSRRSRRASAEGPGRIGADLPGRSGEFPPLRTAPRSGEPVRSSCRRSWADRTRSSAGRGARRPPADHVDRGGWHRQDASGR